MKAVHVIDYKCLMYFRTQRILRTNDGKPGLAKREMTDFVP